MLQSVKLLVISYDVKRIFKVLNSTDGEFTVFAFDDVGDKVNSLLILFHFVEYSCVMLLYIYNLLYFIACILQCD